MPDYGDVLESVLKKDETEYGISPRLPVQNPDTPPWLIAYVYDVAARMALKDWRFYVEVDRSEQTDFGGRCEPLYGRRTATITVIADYLEDDDRLRNTVVHELLHCHMEPMCWHVNGVGRSLLVPVWQMFNDAFIDSLELAVDAIATAWEQTLPYPRRDVGEIAAPKKRKAKATA